MSGSKFDQEKVDLHVLDPLFVEGTARVAQFGEQKYGRSNWMQGLTQSRIINAMRRHLAQIEKGEDIDEESGFHHAYHIAWGCQVLAYQHRNEQHALDDRRWSSSVRNADFKNGVHEGIGGHTVSMLHDGPFGRLHPVTSTEDGLDLPIMQSEATEKETQEDPIKELQQMISDWADKVYPDRTVENALTKMMLHEIPELLHGGAMDPTEFADVAILLFDVAHLQGIDIVQAMRFKMEVNEKRNWEIDPKTGLMSHVKGMDTGPDLPQVRQRCKVIPTGFLTDTRAAAISSKPPSYPWEITIPEWAAKMGDSERVALVEGSKAWVHLNGSESCILMFKNTSDRSHLEKYYCATIKDVETEEEYRVSWSELQPWNA